MTRIWCYVFTSLVAGQAIAADPDWKPVTGEVTTYLLAVDAANIIFVGTERQTWVVMNMLKPGSLPNGKGPVASILGLQNVNCERHTYRLVEAHFKPEAFGRGRSLESVVTPDGPPLRPEPGSQSEGSVAVICAHK